ncbi:MAG: YesL family protein [Lachnospiraceae bacterium]|nr:YesL family protein [Lachnospiraceae bacterium]MBQ9928687.1 YesL family protein [Lachnospiraceae bacterium]
MFQNDSAIGRIMNLLVDILYVGILWVVTSLPIVTAGTATVAAYYAMSKSVRRKTGYIGKEFMRSFKTNFRQSLPLTILFLIILAVLSIDIWYVWTNDSKTNSSIFMVLVLILFLFAGIAIYSFPLLSRFVTGNVNLFRMAFVVMFRFLPVTALMMLFTMVAGIGIYLMPWTVFVIPGGYLYALTFPMEWVMKKIMPAAEEGSDEAEKWYYS